MDLSEDSAKTLSCFHYAVLTHELLTRFKIAYVPISLEVTKQSRHKKTNLLS
jgi:hypothetical protein